MAACDPWRQTALALGMKTAISPDQMAPMRRSPFAAAVTMPHDEALRYCRTCRRDTLQRDTHDCLDATRFVCSVCDGSEVVPESMPYGRKD